MIILDTNVVSELLRPNADAAVIDWARCQLLADLQITAITSAELLRGVARLPPGRRSLQLGSAVAAILDIDYRGRILPFDYAASISFARITAELESAGRPVGLADAQIAAIAHAVGASVATRNVKHFAESGVAIVNPWEHHGQEER